MDPEAETVVNVYHFSLPFSTVFFDFRSAFTSSVIDLRTTMVRLLTDFEIDMISKDDPQGPLYGLQRMRGEARNPGPGPN